MILTVDAPYEFGQIVYLVTDRDQSPCIVTGYKVSVGGSLIVIVQRSTLETTHYLCELSETKNILLETTN